MTGERDALLAVTGRRWPAGRRVVGAGACACACDRRVSAAGVSARTWS